MEDFKKAGKKRRCKELMGRNWQRKSLKFRKLSSIREETDERILKSKLDSHQYFYWILLLLTPLGLGLVHNWLERSMKAILK